MSKQHKCQRCKQLIIDDLYSEPKKDRAGNIKTNTKGIIQYNYYHQKCWDEKVFEWNSWCNLYDYVLEKYFVKQLPTSLIAQLKTLRKNYNFVDILGCLQSLEDNLMKNMSNKNFEGNQKGQYIYVALSNNIDSYYEKQLKKNVEQFGHEENKNFKFIEYHNENTSNENYDIFD